MGNAASLLFREEMLTLLLRSVGLAFAVAILSGVLATVLALLTTVCDLYGRRVLTVLVIAPLAIPSYVAASTWLAACSPQGPVGALFVSLGFSAPQIHGFWGALVVLTLGNLPIAYLPIRGALSRIDAAAFEAARVLGRRPLAALYHGVLPALRPSIWGGSTLVCLYTLSEFGSVSLLRYDSFPRVIYLQFKSAFDRESAAMSALVLVVTIVFVLWLSEKGMGKNTAVIQRGRRLQLALGRYQVLAFLFVATIIAFALGVPLSALALWLSRHSWKDVDWIFDAVTSSLGTGAIAAVATTLLALPLALVAARPTRWWHSVMLKSADLGFALPGLVVALGFVFLTLAAIPALYQTWAMLVVTYAILFLALALAPIRSALLRIPPSLTEAARVLGSDPAATFRRVVLPLLWPGLIAGAVLAWLSAMKELSATILLIPAGEHTLATRLWSYTDEALYAEASLPALLLIGVAAIGTYLALSRREDAM